MRSFSVAALAALSAGLLAGPSFGFGQAEVGRPAPAFAVHDADGRPVSLSAMRGRPVVLEWTNQGCPFVRHMYSSGVMQALQKRAAAQGVTWVSVVSSAPGQQGYMTPPEVGRWRASTGAAPAEVVLDPHGALGRIYGAKATPSLYVIDAKGVLVYMGAIDDRPSVRDSDALTARNYVAVALDDLRDGRPVADPVTTAYGCSVKYGSD